MDNRLSIQKVFGFADANSVGYINKSQLHDAMSDCLSQPRRPTIRFQAGAGGSTPRSADGTAKDEADLGGAEAPESVDRVYRLLTLATDSELMVTFLLTFQII